MTPSPVASARLADHGEFQQLVRIVAAELGLLPVWVEKDYWLVRVLDAMVRHPPLEGHFLFKGGTSLSKAWKLIDRFSEDVDLLLTGDDFGPMPTSKGRRAQIFKSVRAAIELVTPLRLPLEDLTEAEKRFYYLRSDTHGYLRYPLRNDRLAPEASSEEWLLVEAGFRGGSHPRTVVPIRSYLGDYLAGSATQATVAVQYAADVDPIDVPVLAIERTFVEKLLAIHTTAIGDVSKLQARHYYDLSRLYEHDDVKQCLEQPLVLQDILIDAVAVSNTHWGAELEPKTLDLGRSPALIPSAEVRRALIERWRVEETLYPRGQPPLSDVLEIIAQLRAQLAQALPR